MAEKLRILVIGAHPADIFDQSGGTMAHHARRGDWVGALILTHGARIHDEVVASELYKTKEIPQGAALEKILAERGDVKSEEVLRACGILGVPRENVHFLGMDDGVFLVEREPIVRVARMIRKLRPNVVITHLPIEDGGIASPHAVTGQIVMHAVAYAKSVDPGDPHPGNGVAQVFFFGIANPRYGFWDTIHSYSSDVFIDIGDVAELKLKAINSMSSQNYAGDYANKRIESSDGAAGQRSSCSYAEPFTRLYPENHRYLPVTEHALGLLPLSDKEILALRSVKIRTS